MDGVVVPSLWRYRTIVSYDSPASIAFVVISGAFPETKVFLPGILVFSCGFRRTEDGCCCSSIVDKEGSMSRAMQEVVLLQMDEELVETHLCIDDVSLFLLN